MTNDNKINGGAGNGNAGGTVVIPVDSQGKQKPESYISVKYHQLRTQIGNLRERFSTPARTPETIETYILVHAQNMQTVYGSEKLDLSNISDVAKFFSHHIALNYKGNPEEQYCTTLEGLATIDPDFVQATYTPLATEVFLQLDSERVHRWIDEGLIQGDYLTKVKSLRNAELDLSNATRDYDDLTPEERTPEITKAHNDNTTPFLEKVTTLETEVKEAKEKVLSYFGRDAVGEKYFNQLFAEKNTASWNWDKYGTPLRVGVVALAVAAIVGGFMYNRANHEVANQRAIATNNQGLYDSAHNELDAAKAGLEYSERNADRLSGELDTAKVAKENLESKLGTCNDELGSCNSDYTILNRQHETLKTNCEKKTQRCAEPHARKSPRGEIIKESSGKQSGWLPF